MRDSFSLTVNLTAALFASSLNEGAFSKERMIENAEQAL